MNNKIKRMRWEITDHVKDAGYHYYFAMNEIEEGDNRAAKDEQMKGFNRIQEAKKVLDRMAELIKDHEYKEKQAGIKEDLIKEKFCGWRAIHMMLADDVTEMEEELEELKI